MSLLVQEHVVIAFAVRLPGAEHVLTSENGIPLRGKVFDDQVEVSAYSTIDTRGFIFLVSISVLAGVLPVVKATFTKDVSLKRKGLTTVGFPGHCSRDPRGRPYFAAHPQGIVDPEDWASVFGDWQIA
mmetsp:Transcript_53423/g.130876  ORF Transcript_53423/g.130876 Transcript_53423/m.130876 type:complete len:128 (-) Transcript_53423:121-504(-)